MTVTTFVSCKGAPGVTTLACLVGATWPEQRRVVVVEGDYFGGDLAARFRLSVSRGWTSYVTASRRSEGPIALGPHLQALPGGLDVMIGARGGRLAGMDRAVPTLIESCRSADPVPWDLVVDGGRLFLEDVPGSTTNWLDHSDSVVVVLRRDAASILSVRDQTRALKDRWGSRVGLVVVGNGRHHNPAIEDFTGLAVIGEVPFDHVAARVASGGGGAGRHLRRSLLVESARRLSMVLAGTDPVPATVDLAGEQGGGLADPGRSSTRPAARSAGRQQRLRRLGQGRPQLRIGSLRMQGADKRHRRAEEVSEEQEPVPEPRADLAEFERSPDPGGRNSEKCGPEVTPQEAVG